MPTATPTGPPTATPEPTAAPTATPTARPPTATPSLTANPTAVSDLDLRPSQRLQLLWRHTDFSKHSVPYHEIISGGPPPDGIPPVDEPKFVGVVEAQEYMKDEEPVMSLELNGEVKAYPLSILIWHEIVNDEVGGIPVSVTYCPLCNTAIVFDRRVNGVVLDFGTTGLLRKSDLVMWDRQTFSWWQQITGEAIVGDFTGTRLKLIPAPVVSWAEFVSAFPEGKVLSRDTGFNRDYELAPYAGYDDLRNTPFLFSDRLNSRFPPMERIVGLRIGDESLAYPFTLLEEHPVINDSFGGKDFVVFYVGGTLSPFPGDFTFEGYMPQREVGSTGVYEPVVDGVKHTFRVQDDVIVDEETGSKWSILGQAVEGPLEGTQLTHVVHANHFWFAWAAFFPFTDVRTTEDIAD